MATELTQISLNMYSVRSSPLSFENQLRKVRAIGYQSIQSGHNSSLSTHEMKKLLDELGMEISVYGGDLHDINLHSESYVKECRLFNCDEIMIGTMPVEFREDINGYMAGISLMNEVGHKLQKEGIFLSYHNHAQEFRRFSNGKTGMDLLYENLDPSAVHFLLDTHWIQSGGGDVIQWIEKCGDRMQYIHLKDYRIAPANYFTGIGEVDKQFAEVGEGNLPWPLIIETSLHYGIKSFIVEQDFSYETDPFESVAISYNNLVKYGLK